MKKIIEGKRNLLISIVLYCLSISIFLISQLSIVSGTFMSGSVFSYNYPLRVTPYSLGGTRTEYHATPTSAAQPGTSGLM